MERKQLHARFTGSIPGDLVITHWIYHIPDKKVGCTLNLDERKKWYDIEVRSQILVQEILLNCTNQEAGDREWYWAEHFGYNKGTHFTDVVSIRMAAKERKKLAQHRGHLASEIAHEAQVQNGLRAYQLKVGVHGRSTVKMREDGLKGGHRAFELRAGFHSLSPEKRSEASRKGALQTIELKVGLFSLTSEQQLENSRKGGASSRKNGGQASRPGALRTVELGVGLHKRVTCPHCGFEGFLGNLKRWHFDNCKAKVP